MLPKRTKSYYEKDSFCNYRPDHDDGAGRRFTRRTDDTGYDDEDDQQYGYNEEHEESRQEAFGFV